MKCLLLEDNIFIGQHFVEFLSRYNINCVLTTTTDAFLSKLQDNEQNNFSIVIADINIDGSPVTMEDLIKHIRSTRHLSQIPILCYSAHFDVATRVLNAGADDMILFRGQKNNIKLLENSQYIPAAATANAELATAPVFIDKPLNQKDMKELIARIRALTRRSMGNATNEIQIQYLTYNLATQVFSINGAEINFSVKEKAVMECLVEHTGSTCSRRMCMQKLYTQNDIEGIPTLPDAKIIDVFMCRIKQKIREKFIEQFPNRNFGPHEQIIKTVWGMGYKLAGNKKFVAPKVTDTTTMGCAAAQMAPRLVKSKHLKMNSKTSGNIVSLGW